MIVRLALFALVAVAATAAAPVSCDRSSPVPTVDPDSGMASPPRHETPDTVRDQVIALIEQYYVDLSAREWERYAEYFWPGALLTTIWQPPGEPTARVVNTTIEEFIAQAPQGPGSRAIFEERLKSAEVRGSDRIAQVWAKYDARFGDPDSVHVWSGVDAFTLIRHDGRWRITALAYIADDPPR